MKLTALSHEDEFGPREVVQLDGNLYFQGTDYKRYIKPLQQIISDIAVETGAPELEWTTQTAGKINDNLGRWYTPIILTGEFIEQMPYDPKYPEWFIKFRDKVRNIPIKIFSASITFKYVDMTVLE